MIVAGFGFRGAAGVESFRQALAQTGMTPDLLATAKDKAEDTTFLAFARETGLPVEGIDPHGLEAVATQTQSGASQSARGTGSVAEASALAAAGPGARLLTARVISEDRLATCALAIGAET